MLHVHGGGLGLHGFGRAARRAERSLRGAKRAIVSGATSELACQRVPGRAVGVPAWRTIGCLRNGSMYHEGRKGIAKLQRIRDGKLVTADPPFSMIRFMSVPPKTNRARVDRQLEMLTAPA